jgi:hypothetical protein
VYTMDWPGSVICMYVCVGTVSHPFKPTDTLVVAISAVAYVRTHTGGQLHRLKVWNLSYVK